MTARGKRSMLVLALLATLTAAYFAPGAQDDDGVVLAQRVRSGAAVVPAHSHAAPEVLAIRPRGGDDEQAHSSTFGGRWWVAPAAPAPAQAPAVTPEATPKPAGPPALPFRVLGRYADGHDVAVFLQHDGRNLVARVGDTLVERYTVERIDAAVLTLRYLPLDHLQTLDLGAPQ